MASRSFLESSFHRIWQRRGPLARVLLPLALLYRLLSAVRRRLYQRGVLASARLPVPVIVVGNIFVGGTGKTPLTLWLIDALRQAGWTPGVISRGYGADATATPEAVLPDSNAALCGDEPLLIVQRAHCPVVVGRKRIEAGRHLLHRHPEVNVIVADDGLQHYALQRDIEIVLFDTRGHGNGWLLPAGPLRELPSRRRDVTVVNVGSDAAALPPGMPSSAFRMQLAAGDAYALCDPSERRPLSALRDASLRLAAAAGIGNPGRFFAMLHAAGLRFEAMPLPDHYDYRRDPFAGLQADCILITEKDAVKCAQNDTLKNDPRLWVVPVDACFDASRNPAHTILEMLRGPPTA